MFLLSVPSLSQNTPARLIFRLRSNSLPDLTPLDIPLRTLWHPEIQMRGTSPHPALANRQRLHRCGLSPVSFTFEATGLAGARQIKDAVWEMMPQGPASLRT